MGLDEFSVDMIKAFKELWKQWVYMILNEIWEGNQIPSY